MIYNTKIRQLFPYKIYADATRVGIYYPNIDSLYHEDNLEPICIGYIELDPNIKFSDVKLSYVGAANIWVDENFNVYISGPYDDIYINFWIEIDNGEGELEEPLF